MNGNAPQIVVMTTTSAAAAQTVPQSVLADDRGCTTATTSSSTEGCSPAAGVKGNTSHNSALRRIRSAIIACPHLLLLSATCARFKLSHPILHEFLTAYVRPVLVACFVLTSIPLSFYTRETGTLPYEKRGGTFSEVVMGWDALLHLSIWPIVATTSFAGIILAHYNARKADRDGNSGSSSSSHDELSKRGSGSSSRRGTSCESCASACIPVQKMNVPLLPLPPSIQRAYAAVHRKWPFGAAGTLVVGLSLLFSILTSSQSQLQIVSPGWRWNPFLWGKYRVYRPSGIEAALEGVCVDEFVGDGTVSSASSSHSTDHIMPLCLKESSWRSLSAEALSSRNTDDVDTVLRGLRYARQPDHGMIINVMSRDTIGAIEPLRQNVEGLLPFFDKVAVVVFENDSTDGSRNAFKAWAEEVKDSYVVDVMECDDATDCVFGESHRYDAVEADNYWTSSAIGRMAEFRQRIVDHILDGGAYADYSHMMVVDLDLKVSLSPLGILHTLGKKTDAAVASSGRQTWPASLGTFVNPYDFSGFRSLRSPRNARILDLHKRFCELMPPGDRWRNQCDAVSPMMLMLVFGHDRNSGEEPYPVASAFNGATLYPLSLVKSSGAKYDWGKDGQQCEHIGFNLSLKKTMYVNPKWDMHISPAEPGGPTGPRAMKTVSRIVFTPRISLLIFFQNLGSMLLFVHSVLVLSTTVLYKGWTKILTGTKVKYLVMPWNSPATKARVSSKSLLVELDSDSDYDEEQPLVGSISSAHDVRKRGTADSPTTSV